MQKSSKNKLKHRAYSFSVTIIKFVATLPNTRVYWVIADQLLRAATSIGANIVEAQAASSKRDFLRFYEIALESANETLYWLGLLRDATDISNQNAHPLLQEAKTTANILGASLLTLKGKRKL